MLLAVDSLLLPGLPQICANRWTAANLHRATAANRWQKALQQLQCYILSTVLCYQDVGSLMIRHVLHVAAIFPSVPGV